MKQLLLKLSVFCLLLTALGTQANTAVISLQSRWAEIKYTLPEDQQEQAFKALAAQSQALVDTKPHTAEHWVWHGIITSTWAGAKGGLGALKLVKQAKTALEKALALDENALQGSAYTSLGALYYQVPGWPIAFGSKKKAQQFLEKGLVVNPDGIDSNFFYGEFLVKQHEYDKARNVLEHALEAAPRPQRPVADQGRREEIKQLLASINS